MATQPPICDFGWQAPDFSLPGTDGRTYSYSDISGPNGTLIMFICNHCPYVKATTGRLMEDMAEIGQLGIGVAAICANDADNYPEDSFANMEVFARESGFKFPYLHDASQEVARAYGAICTPDFFGFNAAGELQYRGRLDEGRTTPPPTGYRHDLLEAMGQIAETGKGPATQIASIGCSIKWKPAA